MVKRISYLSKNKIKRRISFNSAGKRVSFTAKIPSKRKYFRKVKRRNGITKMEMRNLYKHLRKRGLSKSEAFKNVGLVKRLSVKYGINKGKSWKFKRKYAYKDFDGDGKVNKYDCEPLNYRKQDKWTAKKFLESEESDGGSANYFDPSDLLDKKELKKYNNIKKKREKEFLKNIKKEKLDDWMKGALEA